MQQYVVKSLSRVRLCNPLDCSTPGVPILNSLQAFGLMFTESVTPSNRLIHCHSLLLLLSIFLGIWDFSDELTPQSGDQSTGASVSASMLPMNIQDWFPLELTDLIFLQSKTLKSFPTSSILRCSAFFMVQFSHPYVTTRKTISTLITF